METKISDYVMKRGELAAPPDDMPKDIFLQSRGVILPTSSTNDDTILSASKQTEEDEEMKKAQKQWLERKQNSSMQTSLEKEVSLPASSPSSNNQENFEVKIEKTKKRSARNGYSLPWKQEK
jgi:hypothetical protein